MTRTTNLNGPSVFEITASITVPSEMGVDDSSARDEVAMRSIAKEDKINFKGILFLGNGYVFDPQAFWRVVSLVGCYFGLF